VQLVRFLVVGALNSALGLAVIYLLMAAGVDYRVANALGYAFGFVVSFFANRAWTFVYRGGWWPSFARWLAVSGVAYSGNLATVIGLHKGLGVDARIAQFAGIPVYTALSYLGAKRFAFAGSRAS
jgi:putative flippase GtrA